MDEWWLKDESRETGADVESLFSLAEAEHDGEEVEEEEDEFKTILSTSVPFFCFS